MKCPRYYDSRMLAMSAAAAMAVAVRFPTSHMSSLSNNHAIIQSPTDSRLVVNRLSMNDVEVAKNLFTRSFPLSATHSWSRALGLNRTLDGYMASYLPTHIQNPLLGCVAARIRLGSEETNTELVGALLLEFMKNPNEKEEVRIRDEHDTDDGDGTLSNEGTTTTEELDEATSLAYAAIDGIMNECRSIFHRKLQDKYKDDAINIKSGYVAWIAVDEHFRGTGVASALICNGNKLLKDSGCRYAVAFTMSPTSTRVFHKNGYERWGFITYSNYEMNGIRPFSILPDELSVMVCDLELIQQ